MKKHLFCTVALIALYPFSSLHATETCVDGVCIDTDTQNLRVESGSHNNLELNSNYDGSDLNNISINGADVEIHNVDTPVDANNNLNVTQGTLKLENSDVDVFNDVTVNGGTMEIQNADTSKHINIGNDLNVESGKFILNGSETSDGTAVNIEVFNDVNVSGGEFQLQNVDNAKITNDLHIDGGTVSLSGTNIPIHGDELKMTGGNLVIDQSAIATGTGEILISGGNITLEGKENSETNQANRALLMSPSNNMNITGSNTVINMKGYSSIHSLNTKKDLNGNYYAGTGLYNLTLQDAVLNVSGTDNVLGAGGDISINNGTINIEDDSDILIAGNTIMHGHLIPGDPPPGTVYVVTDGTYNAASTLQMSNNSVINLKGNLNSSISGENSAINFLTENSHITEDVQGVDLNFHTDHSLSSAIGKTVGPLNSLNVMNGTLTTDKTPGHINTLQVNNNAGLDLDQTTIDAGNVVFGDNAKLYSVVASRDQFGHINANTISLGSNNTLDVNLQKGIINRGETAEFTFLNGTSGVTGEFSDRTVQNKYRYFLSWLDEYTLKIGLRRSIREIIDEGGGTPEDYDAGEAWDEYAAGESEIADLLYDLSITDSNAYVNAIQIVEPDQSPSMQHIVKETTNQVFDAVNTRLSNAAVAKGRSRIATDYKYPRSRGSVWMHGIYNKAKLEDHKKTKGFDADTSGVAIGLEALLAPSMTVGVGYAFTKTDIDGYHRDHQADAHTAFIYQEYKPKNWFFNSIASYSKADYEESKNLGIFNIKGKSDLDIFGLQVMTGYDFHTPILTFTPNVGLRYAHLEQDKYRDNIGQEIKPDDLDILTGILGAKFSQMWVTCSGIILRPEISAAITYDLINDDYTTHTKLSNNYEYVTKAKSLKRQGVEVGAGLTAEFNRHAELSMGYSGRYKEHYKDHTGMLSARYKF